MAVSLCSEQRSVALGFSFLAATHATALAFSSAMHVFLSGDFLFQVCQLVRAAFESLRNMGETN